MVSVRDALLDKNTTLGPTPNHANLEELAGYFVRHGATDKLNTVRLRTAVKVAEMRAKISRPTAYRIFQERPGFVTTRNSDGDKVVYYEWEVLKPLVEKQAGAEYYPKNLAPLVSSVEVNSQTEPAWKFRDSSAWSGRVINVPTVNDAVLEKLRPHLTLPNITTKAEAEGFISAVVTMYENGEFDEGSDST